jgi:predicted O-methyltransferase YrrM
VVAIDLCPRPEEERGLEVAMALAKRAGLKVSARKARSPDDVTRVCREEFAGPVDLAFIDGGHTPAQQTLDFEACRTVVGTPGVYVFHDVVNFGMTASFVDIARANPQLEASLLLRTPSGMAIAYDRQLHADLGPVVRTFTESDARVTALHAEIRRRTGAAKT